MEFLLPFLMIFGGIVVAIIEMKFICRLIFRRASEQQLRMQFPGWYVSFFVALAKLLGEYK